MKKIKYYVGILPQDQPRFWEYVFNLNEDTDAMYHVRVVGEFDDPGGYYSFTVEGTWESYKCFLNAAKMSFVKSVEHFEQD
jgi:hypothetical protein